MTEAPDFAEALKIIVFNIIKLYFNVIIPIYYKNNVHISLFVYQSRLNGKTDFCKIWDTYRVNLGGYRL